MNNSRLQDVRRILSQKDTETILMTQQKNVSWFIGGRTHINIASEPSCCFVLVTSDECVLIVNNIEAKRMIDEELASDIANEITDTKVWNWYEPHTRDTIIQTLTAGKSIKTDVELENDFLEIRSIIPDSRLDELRKLGVLTAQAIEQTAKDIQQGDSEYKIAGKLAFRCYERELDPVVNLIAVDERAFLRRHPLPTSKQLDTYAMLVVCARKDGLIASATRLVHFGEISEEIKQKHEAVVTIDAQIIAATKSGTSLTHLYEDLKQYYHASGFGEEYQFHHQGGLTGYATRERLSTPSEKLKVKNGQLYAWNPTIAGVKSEDTILVQNQQAEIITVTDEFPSIDIEVDGKVYQRPAILQRY
ncbi:MAG TPA: M24 family metallopeptidase [Bacillaceae bacterium]|nr:M24 family metallopeptidase [Bacillaceae bacterium]